MKTFRWKRAVKMAESIIADAKKLAGESHPGAGFES